MLMRPLITPTLYVTIIIGYELEPRMRMITLPHAVMTHWLMTGVMTLFQVLNIAKSRIKEKKIVTYIKHCHHLPLPTFCCYTEKRSALTIACIRRHPTSPDNFTGHQQVAVLTGLYQQVLKLPVLAVTCWQTPRFLLRWCFLQHSFWREIYIYIFVAIVVISDNADAYIDMVFAISEW